MVSLTLDIIPLMSSPNVEDVSNIRTKYFGDETCWFVINWFVLKWFVIKKHWRMYNFFDLTSKINFLHLLRRVSISTHFSFESRFIYFA